MDFASGSAVVKEMGCGSGKAITICTVLVFGSVRELEETGDLIPAFVYRVLIYWERHGMRWDEMG